jgi:hypothetical protein
MQLYVTYAIEKASLTKIIVLHDVTSRVMAQADSLWQLTAEARFGAMAMQCGNCGLQSATETGFLRILQFSFVSIIPHMLHIHSSVTDAL